ncbi:uncharacterized protein LOC144109920 isoform X1 [Amblyomma americanum]
MDQSSEDRERNRRSAAPPLSRPPSEQLVDLHVYIVPEERWLRKRKLARNHVVDYAISAGFIRVLPTARLVDVRQEIDRQLGHDVVPKEYVFLRSVGRNFTQVKDFQEMDLKAKSFLPPCASEPEIYLKSGQFADHSWSHGDESGLDEAYLDARRTHEIIERRIGALSPPLSSPEGFLPHVDSTRLLLSRPSKARRSGGASNGTVANGAAATTTYHWSTSNGGSGGGTRGSGGGPYQQQHRVTTTTTTTTHRSTTTVEETSVRDSVHLHRLPAPRDERDRVEREGKPVAEGERQEQRALDVRTEDRVHEEHTAGEADGPELSDAPPPASVRRRSSVASSGSGVTGGADAKDLAPGDDAKDQRTGPGFDASPSQQEQQREASAEAEAAAPSPAGSVRDRSRSDGAGTITLTLPSPSSGPARAGGAQRRPSLTEARRRSVAAVPVQEGSRLSVPLQQRKLSFAGAPVGGQRRGDEESGGQRLKSQAQSEEAVSQDIEGESERPRRRPSREADSRRSSTAAPVERGGDREAGQEADAEEKPEAGAEGAREDRGSSSAEEASSEREARADADQASPSGEEGREVAGFAPETEKGARSEEEEGDEQRDKDTEVRDGGRWEVREPEGESRYFQEEGPYRLEVTEEEENEPVAQSQTSVAPAVGKEGDVAAAAAPSQRTSWRTTGGGDKAYRRSKYPTVEPQLQQKQQQQHKQQKTRVAGVTRGAGSKQVAAGAKTPAVTTMSGENNVGATQKHRQGRRSRGQSGVTVQVAKVRLIPGRPAVEAGTTEANAEESEIREYVRRGDTMRGRDRDEASRKTSTRHAVTNIDTARTVVESYRKSDAVATEAAKKPKRERTFDVEVYVTEMGDTGTQTGSATDGSGKAIKERGSSSKGGGGGSGVRRRSRSHKSLSKSETRGSLHGDKGNARTTGGGNTTDADGSSLADSAATLVDNVPQDDSEQPADGPGNLEREQSGVELDHLLDGQERVAEHGVDEGVSADDEGSGDENITQRNSLTPENGSVGLENGIGAEKIQPALAELQSSQKSPEPLDTKQYSDHDGVGNDSAPQGISEQGNDLKSNGDSNDAREDDIMSNTNTEEKPQMFLEAPEPVESIEGAEEPDDGTQESVTLDEIHAGHSKDDGEGNSAQSHDISANNDNTPAETVVPTSEDALSQAREPAMPDEVPFTSQQAQINDSPRNTAAAAQEEGQFIGPRDSADSKPEDVEANDENNAEKLLEAPESAKESESGETNDGQNNIWDAKKHIQTTVDKNNEEAVQEASDGENDSPNNDAERSLSGNRKSNEMPETAPEIEAAESKDDLNDASDNQEHVATNADINSREAAEGASEKTEDSPDKAEEIPLSVKEDINSENLSHGESGVDAITEETNNDIDNASAKDENDKGSDLKVGEAVNGQAEMDTERSVSVVGTRPGTAVVAEASESKDDENHNEDLINDAIEKTEESAATAKEEHDDDVPDLEAAAEEADIKASVAKADERNTDSAPVSQEQQAEENELTPTSGIDMIKSSEKTDEQSDKAHIESLADNENSVSRSETHTDINEGSTDAVENDEHADSVKPAINEPEMNSSTAGDGAGKESGEDMHGEKDAVPSPASDDVEVSEVVHEEDAAENGTLVGTGDNVEHGQGTESEVVEDDQISKEEANITSASADVALGNDMAGEEEEKKETESVQDPEVHKTDEVVNQHSDVSNEDAEVDVTSNEKNEDSQGESGDMPDGKGDSVLKAASDHEVEVTDKEPSHAVVEEVEPSDRQQDAGDEPTLNHGGEDPISSDSAPAVETEDDNAEPILAADEGGGEDKGQGEIHLEGTSGNAEDSGHSNHHMRKEQLEADESAAPEEMKDVKESEGETTNLSDAKADADDEQETVDNLAVNAEEQDATNPEDPSANTKDGKYIETNAVPDDTANDVDAKEVTEEAEASLPAATTDRASPTTDLDTSRAEDDSAFADGTCTSTPSPATSRAEMTSPKDLREGENLDEGILADEPPLNKDSLPSQEEDADGAVDATSSSSGRGSRGTVTEVPIPAVHKPQIRGTKAEKDGGGVKPPRIKAPRGVDVLPTRFKPAPKRNVKGHSIAGTGGVRRVRSDGEKIDQAPVGASRTALTTPEQRLDKGAARLLGRHSRSVNMEEQGVVEIARLQKKLDALREERLACEAKREDLLRRAKFLQSKATSTRDQARDMWRRRYAEEKKITPKLEEESSRWRLELERLHRELLARVEGELRLTGYPRFEQPSNKLSYKIMIAKVLQEIEDLKRRLEYTRISLGAEVRLRTHAEREVKNLREDLLKKKIQVTLTKKETQSVMAPFLRDSFYFVGPI